MKIIKTKDLKNKVIIPYSGGAKILLLAGAVFLLAFAQWMFRLAFRADYVQFIELGFGLFFLVFGLLCLLEISKQIIIHREEVILKNLLREKIIPKEEIEGYCQIISGNTKKRSTVLMILLKNGKRVNFYKDNWGSQYPKIKKALKLEYEEISYAAKQKIINKTKNWYKNIGVAGGLFFVLFGLFQLCYQQEIVIEETIVIEGVISGDPVITARKKSQSSSFFISIEAYPDFKFSVTGSKFQLLDDGIENLKEKEVIELQILQKDFNEKLVATTNPSLQAKHWDRSNIPLYGIRQHEKTFLWLHDINSGQTDYFQRIFPILFGIGLMVFYQFFSKGYD